MHDKASLAPHGTPRLLQVSDSQDRCLTREYPSWGLLSLLSPVCHPSTMPGMLRVPKSLKAKAPEG